MTVNSFLPRAQLIQVGTNSAEDTQMSSYIVFRIHAQFFALPLAAVTRVLRMVALTPIPDAPPWVLGMINYAGRMLPALSLGQRLGLPVQQPSIHHRLLVTADVMWVVDEVLSVIELNPAQVELPSNAVIQTRSLAGSFQYQDHLVLLLDPAGLRPEGELLA
jgi:purine-binding chemotaxis protein CheW